MKYLLMALTMAWSGFSLNGQDVAHLQRPTPAEGLIVWRSDNHVISPAQEASLERQLLAYADSTSTQFSVVFVDHVDDNISLAATELAHNWGIGQAGQDNGLLLLIALDDRDMALSVGYGLEANLTDFRSHRIIEDILKPHFKSGDFAAGIQGGLNAVAQVLSGEFEAIDQGPQRGRAGKWGKLLGILFMIIVYALMSRRGGLGGGLGTGMLLGGGYVVGPMGRQRHRGGFGGFGGGMGGGGFGGFGGGGFGGGGASGSW